MKIPGGWSKYPHAIHDAIPSMNPADVVCMLVLIRETYGYHRRQARLTYKDFKCQSGIKSKTTIAASLKAIEAQGFFRRTGGHRSEWEIGTPLEPAARADGRDTEKSANVSTAEVETKHSHSDSNGSNIELTVATNGSIIEPNDSANSSNNEPKTRPNSSNIEPFHIYKERSPLGKEREGERKGRPARALPRSTGRVVDQDKPLPERPDGDDSANGGRWVMHPEVPRPRTAEERDLAARPGTAVWLDAGMSWPGWERLEEITEQLGREPQFEVLKKARKMWLMAGYRLSNTAGILDWYDALCRDPTWRPFTRTKGQSGRAADGKNGPCSPTMAMLLDMEQELTHGKRSDHDTMFDSAAVSIPADGVWGGVGEDLPDDASRY